MAFGLLIPFLYLLGAVPFGLLIARLVRRIDVREYGSGNTGASNVLRAAGLWPALAVLVLDMGKGVLAVILARIIDPSPSLEVAAALSVLIGQTGRSFYGFGGERAVPPGLAPSAPCHPWPASSC